MCQEPHRQDYNTQAKQDELRMELESTDRDSALILGTFLMLTVQEGF